MQLLYTVQCNHDLAHLQFVPRIRRWSENRIRIHSLHIDCNCLRPYSEMGNAKSAKQLKFNYARSSVGTPSKNIRFEEHTSARRLCHAVWWQRDSRLIEQLNSITNYEKKKKKNTFFVCDVFHHRFHYPAKCPLCSDEFAQTNTILRGVSICSLIHHIITELELVAVLVARTPTLIKIVSFCCFFFSIWSIRHRCGWFCTTNRNLFGSAINHTKLNVSQLHTDAQSIWPHHLSVFHSHSLLFHQLDHLDHWSLIWLMNFSIKRNKNYGWLVCWQLRHPKLTGFFFPLFQFSSFGICLCPYQTYFTSIYRHCSAFYKQQKS